MGNKSFNRYKNTEDYYKNIRGCKVKSSQGRIINTISNFQRLGNKDPKPSNSQRTFSLFNSDYCKLIRGYGAKDCINSSIIKKHRP